MEFALPPGLELNPLEDFDDGFGIADDAEMSSWPFLPLVSQLESMPLDFGMLSSI